MPCHLPRCTKGEQFLNTLRTSHACGDSVSTSEQITKQYPHKVLPVTHIAWSVIADCCRIGLPATVSRVNHDWLVFYSLSDGFLLSSNQLLLLLFETGYLQDVSSPLLGVSVYPVHFQSV